MDRDRPLRGDDGNADCGGGACSSGTKIVVAKRIGHMSALGQKRSSRHVCVTSGLPLIADMRRTDLDVGFVPVADTLRPTSLTRTGGSSYSEEPGMEIL